MKEKNQKTIKKMKNSKNEELRNNAENRSDEFETMRNQETIKKNDELKAMKNQEAINKI